MSDYPGMISLFATIHGMKNISAAVAMLCTGMYLAGGNSSGFDTSNALNSFLENEINNIASKALNTSTVDVDMGLEQTTREGWVCLYRAHYLSLGLNMDQIPISSQLMDVTDYPEMAELLRVSDALISDYSCTAGDFALRGKPIWLYVADIDEYTRYSRELYVNPLDTPYWCARTPSELDTLIRQTTPEKARENCQEILEYYGTHETGSASEEAARYICSKLLP